MNALAVFNPINPTLTIADHVINMVDGLYSLNDLHKASGNENKHRPSYFMQNQETKDLIGEIEKQTSSDGIPSVVFKIVNGGLNRGTYACKELVYRYAMWISPKFALIVIRAFDALITRTDSEQRKHLVSACTKLSVKNMNISDVYLMVGQHFGYDDGIKHIPTPLLPEAIAFVYEQILSRNKANVMSDTQDKPRYDRDLERLLNRCVDIAMNMAQITHALGTNDRRRQIQAVIDDIYAYQDSHK